MFRWLVRGVIFIVIASVVSATNQEPAAGLFAAILIFAIFYAALGLLKAVVRNLRIAWPGASRASHGNRRQKRLSAMEAQTR
jgi:hypothetical protein